MSAPMLIVECKEGSSVCPKTYARLEVYPCLRLSVWKIGTLTSEEWQMTVGAPF